MCKREDRLIGDAEIAAYLRCSRSWVRKQRMRRKHGIPHSLKLDPVYVASMPRYWLSAFEAWVDGLTPRTPNLKHLPPKKAA